METKEFKVGDKVLITGCPVTGNEYSDYDYKKAQNTVGVIRHIYKYGERNIVVSWGEYHSTNYYSLNDLTTPKGPC